MKAEPISTPEVLVEEATDVMLLMVSTHIWDLLVSQAQGSGTTPGSVLSEAVRAYIEEQGVDEARELLKRLDGQPVAQVGGARR